MEKNSEEKLISAFQRAAEQVPAYKKILEENRVRAKEINNLEKFQSKVPVLKKKDTFKKFRLKDLCIEGNLGSEFTAITSSGFSQDFSYGIITKDDETSVKKMADFLLSYLFQADKKKTVAINALSGVNFSASIPIIITGAKSDAIRASFNTLKQDFEQFIIFSNSNFAKKINEDCGKEAGWREKVSLIIGSEWASNSLVNYLKSFINENTAISMGLTELGLNLFNDSPVLSRAREIIQKDSKLMKDLFGNIKACPEIMFFYPERYFLEVINKDENEMGELIFTMLDSLRIPMIRYNSEDIGKTFSSNEFFSKLKEAGHNLEPEFDLPIVAVFGRSNHLKLGNNKIYPQDINEAFYRDFSIAEKITGCFKISKEKIEIQLKKQEKPSEELIQKIEKTLSNFLGVNIPVKLYEYKDFPYSIALDYENKFKLV